MNAPIATMEIGIDPSSEEKRREKRRGIIYQVFICIIANTTVLGPAMGLGYSAIALPSLLSSKSDLKITGSQASWIASVTTISTPIGCILSSFVMRRGRRCSLLVTSGVSLIGWIVIYFSTNFEHILAGRILSGIASGLTSASAIVYVAEVSSPKLRNIVVTWASVAIAVGILIVYIFGYVFQENWRLVALASGFFPTFSIILVFLLVPESPIWLRDRGRMDEAQRVLKKFRGIPEDYAAPAEVMAELKVKQPKKKQNLMKHIFGKTALKPFGIMLGYFFFQQFSGVFVVVFYAVDVVRDVGITTDAYLVAILIGLTRLIGTILVSYASRRFGRRVLSVVSGAGMTFFMVILSLYLYLMDRDCRIDDGGLIPAVCIVMYIFTSTMGFLVLPFAMVGEIFPAKVKDLLSGWTTCLAYVFSFSIVKTYPDMLAVMGRYGVFLFYCVMSLLGTIFVLKFLPETRGKTLQEIEELFAKTVRDGGDFDEKEKIFDSKHATVVST